MADITEQNLIADPELKFAVDLARLADQTRCHNVILLDVRQKSPVTKFFLIATGTSDRQRRTVGDELVQHGKLNGFPAWRTNGYETAKWIVVDFIDVVAHIFEEASRNFYDLEMLWGDCPRVQWQQPGQAATPVPLAPAIPVKPALPTPTPVAEIPSMAEEAELAADGGAGLTGEPEVEEFVDQYMLIADSDEDDEIVESVEDEFIAVPSPSSKPLKPGKTKAAMAKPRIRMAAKPVKPSKRAKSPGQAGKASAKVVRGKTAKAKTPQAQSARAAKPLAKKATEKKPLAKKPLAKKNRCGKPHLKKLLSKKLLEKAVPRHQTFRRSRRLKQKKVNADVH